MAQKTASGLPTIGDVIRAWRKFHGLRSTELAEKARVRSQYLSEIEHNRTANPREEYLEKLAAALKITLRDIYARQMPPEDRVVTTPNSQQGAAGQGSQKESSATATNGQQLRRRRSGALASPPMEEPPLVSHSDEATTVGQAIDEVIGGLSQEECNRLREILVPHVRQLVRLIKLHTGG
jgi:transcriptional regulator with XRE-family HTH domain